MVLIAGIEYCFITLAPIFGPEASAALISAPKPQSRTPTHGGPAPVSISLKGVVGWGRAHVLGTAVGVPKFQQHVQLAGSAAAAPLEEEGCCDANH